MNHRLRGGDQGSSQETVATGQSYNLADDLIDSLGEALAQLLDVSASGLRKWEQGDRTTYDRGEPLLQYSAGYQNALANPASLRTPFAVCRDLILTGTAANPRTGVGDELYRHVNSALDTAAGLKQIEDGARQLFREFLHGLTFEVQARHIVMGVGC